MIPVALVIAVLLTQWAISPSGAGMVGRGDFKSDILAVKVTLIERDVFRAGSEMRWLQGRIAGAVAGDAGRRLSGDGKGIIQGLYGRRR